MELLSNGLWIIVLLVVLAIAFDFMNGFHDAANSIATVVSTGVLKPHRAVLFAAFFNFVAIFIFHLSVAATVGKGIIVPEAVNNHVIFGALIGAIAWNIITWHFGIPSSSSHALIGGLLGAGAAHAHGTSVWVWAGITKTVTFIFIAPFVGYILGGLIMFILLWVLRNRNVRKTERHFKVLQLFSAAAYSLGHGGNDAQKTVGIIWLLLISAGYVGAGDTSPPSWVVVSCYLAIALGTMCGGWRIVKTMGQKITKIRPMGGFAAETSGSIALFMATFLGVPVSTTHTITGSIIGVGTVQSAKAVRWGVAGGIVWAWILTIPASGAIAALFYYFSLLLF